MSRKLSGRAPVGMMRREKLRIDGARVGVYFIGRHAVGGGRQAMALAQIAWEDSIEYSAYARSPPF